MLMERRCSRRRAAVQRRMETPLGMAHPRYFRSASPPFHLQRTWSISVQEEEGEPKIGWKLGKTFASLGRRCRKMLPRLSITGRLKNVRAAIPGQSKELPGGGGFQHTFPKPQPQVLPDRRGKSEAQPPSRCSSLWTPPRDIQANAG